MFFLVWGILPKAGKAFQAFEWEHFLYRLGGLLITIIVVATYGQSVLRFKQWCWVVKASQEVNSSGGKLLVVDEGVEVRQWQTKKQKATVMTKLGCLSVY